MTTLSVEGLMGRRCSPFISLMTIICAKQSPT
jgi:hypothetical protein